ncbi:MAG: hypothetical protein LBO70_03890 [Clostridiales Family XIII bacterium]|nr:hypothetical protein [Clostridiales Family XIII bacterium]
MKFDGQKFFEIAIKDPEFNREIRYFDGTVKLLMGNDTYLLVIKDGVLINVLSNFVATTTADVTFIGDDYQWVNLLAAVPKPFYQCLQTACVKHGMKMTNDPKSLAYLPAWNRMIRILRDKVING